MSHPTRALLTAVGVIVTGAIGAASAAVTPEQAIASAVTRALGVRTAVSIGNVQTTVLAEAGLVAEPDPTARVAKRSRFVLQVHGVRRGLAVATVHARGPLVRASRPIARDETIVREAVESAEIDLPMLPIRALPSEGDVIGRLARRALAIREPLTLDVLRVSPTVRSGDEVTMTVRIGSVRVSGVGRASGSGQVGDRIRVMKPNSLQLLPARIVGPGAVEILE